MDLSFSSYQSQAIKSDILPRNGDSDDLVLPLLGIVGEVGALAAEWKKRRRDEVGYRAFKDAVHEELGDALWYIVALADREGLELSSIAASNLEKVAGEYIAGLPPRPHELYDENRGVTEQLPRRLAIRFTENNVKRGEGDELGVVTLALADDPQITIGDPIDDNSENDDFYRFHDAFHLAFMAVLGWSPVVRSIMRPSKLKRRDGRTDRVEDGARAVAIEEGISATVFGEAAEYSYFRTATRIPRDVLKSCMRVTAHLEVANRSAADWQHALLAGYRAFNFLVDERSGVLVVDMNARTLVTYTNDAYSSEILPPG